MTTTPTLDQLQRGLAIAEQIAALEAEMKAIFVNPSAPIAKSAAVRGKTFKRSAATIAKMKAAQQARWAKVKTPTASKSPVKKKGTMSAEGRAAIVAAQKARWAKIKGVKAPAASKAPAKAAVKQKSTMSPEARAKMAAAMKARREAKKAQKAE